MTSPPTAKNYPWGNSPKTMAQSPKKNRKPKSNGNERVEGECGFAEGCFGMEQGGAKGNTGDSH